MYAVRVRTIRYVAACAALTLIGCPGPKAEQRPADGAVVIPPDDAALVGTRWPDLVACTDEVSVESVFCDNTTRSGIGRTDVANEGEQLAGGVALADFDGDGDLDIYVSGLSIDGTYYSNDGSGVFTDATTTAGLTGVTRTPGVAAADLDGDGDQDLVMTGANAKIRLFENAGAAVFTEVVDAFGTEAVWSTGVAVADIDNDGDLDVLIARALDATGTGPATNLLFRNDGSLSFTDVTASAGIPTTADATVSVLFGDFDATSGPDIFVANDGGPLLVANLDLRNDGAGNFTSTTSGAELAMFARGAATADYDNDGDIDIYVSDLGNNVLLQNDGSGGFTDVASTVAARGGSYSDVEDPVDPPPEFDETMFPTLYAWAQRALEFSDRHAATSWAPVWLDYDQDGWLDIYVCNGYLGLTGFEVEGRRQPNFMYHGRGDGLFEDVSETSNSADTGDARGCAAGDLDGDGDLDLVVANVGYDGDISGGRFVILRNDASDGGFFKVALQGVTANRDGVGAKVELTIAGETQTRWITASSGGLSSKPPVAHFGVGSAKTVDTIVLTWPSGTVDTLSNQTAGQSITVVEGANP